MQKPSEHSTKPPRLKIILLGSAGAGKTSLLRRFVNGTFHSVGDNHVVKSRKQRNTMSTLGADYYVKRMENPLFGSNDQSLTLPTCEKCRAAAQDVWQDSPKRTQQCQRMKNESHVLVQLWDTRGPEPSLYRYNRNRMNVNMYQFLSAVDNNKQHAVLGDYQRCGYHVHRYNNWGVDTPSKWEGCIDLSVPKQKISTMLREKSIMRNETEPSLQRRNSSPNALLDNIDACMLVYDATSSTSFLRLMSCHKEWIERFQSYEPHKSGATGKRRVPFIVVANKIDLLDGFSNATSICQKEKRSVMGFQSYRGIDEKYEYACENAVSSQECRFCYGCSDSKYHQEQHNFHTTKTNRRNKKLTYSLKETFWLSDHHYLSSIQQADNELGANRTMVLLWCKHNGIQHVEASALDGRGVDLAMNELVRLSVQEKIHENLTEKISCEDNVTNEGFHVGHSYCSVNDLDTKEEEYPSSGPDEILDKNDTNSTASLFDNQNVFLYQPSYDKKLDLLARYAEKEDKRCTLRCFGC